MEWIGSCFDWNEEIRGGRLDGEALFYLGSGDAMDYGAKQTAGAPRRIVMKSGAIGAVTRHAAGATMMLTVAAAAWG
jgi:hypothetical protein